LRGKSGEAARTGAPVRSSTPFGVIIAGDMTCPGDRGLRVAEEIRGYASEGLKVGIVQTLAPRAGTRIAPGIQSCVRRGLATLVVPSSELSTDLMVVHAASEVSWSDRPLGDIRSARTVLVSYRPEDYRVQRIIHRLKASGEVVWAPTNTWLRAAAPASLPLTTHDWSPRRGGDAGPPHAPRRAVGSDRYGWLVSTGARLPPAGSDDDVLVIDLEREVDFSLDRLGMLDGIAYFPLATETALPDTLIGAAIACGLPVALPDWLEPHYGPRPHYCEPEDAIRRLTGTRRKAPDSAEQPNGRSLQRKSDRPPRNSPRRPVIFAASNGVGIGHLSRLVAIARRMEPTTPILFATQAQAVGAVERLGYLAHYMPSANYVGGDFDVWDEWFRYDLEQLIDAYDASLVVYDGNNPSPGLIRAVAPRRDCRLAWVRRGLWGNLDSPFIDNSRWFDIILEPGELEGQPDDGVTARRRDEAIVVPPIRLLDAADLLTREDAAKALGLDPGRPAALIQLGAGYNRDVVALLDQLIGTLQQQVPQLQLAIAEWVNGAQALNYWPNVTYLRGYPLSQYFAAFDFSVAAAGYNTFHEVMSFGLPTIFIPNRHPTMDDQAARALHAQALQAAFELDEADLSDLPDLVTLLIDDKARDFLIGNARKLHRPNGATDAARELTRLLESVA
jgi:hypothetical protein